MKVRETESAERGRGRVFQPKGRRVWMLAYYGPKGDGTRGEIRESSKTHDEGRARKILERKMREVANDQDGIADFEGPAQKRTTVAVLFDDLLEFYQRQEIKSLDDARYRVREGSPLRRFFGGMRAADVTTTTVDRYINLRRCGGPEKRDDQPRDRATPPGVSGRTESEKAGPRSGDAGEVAGEERAAGIFREGGTRSAPAISSGAPG